MASKDFDAIAKEQFKFIESGFGFQLSKMKKKDFEDIIKNHFDFLEDEFGFKLVKSNKYNWGYEIIYKNKVTGIVIRYEYREAYVFIMLYKLVNGVLIENQLIIKEDSVLYGYGLDDILSLRNPADLVKPSYQYGEESDFQDKETGLSLYISLFANNLKKYASDILSGDFTVFEKLENVVKERIKKYK